MTELIPSPASALVALDLWRGEDVAGLETVLGFALPDPGKAVPVGSGYVLRVGPWRWWLDGDGFDGRAIASALGERGAVTPLGGAWRRVRLVGDDWRGLLMLSGLFDAEGPSFGAGSVASTLLCHAPCCVHVLPDAVAEVYVPSSLAEHCLAEWEKAGWKTRLAAPAIWSA